MLLCSLLATGLLPVIVAASTSVISSSTSSAIQCFTLQTWSPGPALVPTSTSRTTKSPSTIVITSTSTPTKTVMPYPSTTTHTFTVTVVKTTTASIITDVFSTTRTLTTTLSSTETDTVTSTTTTFTTISTTVTSVVPTSSGFIPIYNSTGESTPEQVQKRRVQHPHKPRAAKSSVPSTRVIGSTAWEQNRRPKAVNCVDYVQVYFTDLVTVTAKTTSTSILRAWTVPTTTIVTVTSTKTVCPSTVSTTVTISTTRTTTTTISTTTTATSTETSTQTATSTTLSYAACASNNILGPQLASNSYYINSILLEDSQSVDAATNKTDPYSCCVLCQNTPGCLFSIFVTNAVPPYCNNVIDTTKTCDPTYQAGLYYASSSPTFEGALVLSNGNCGVVGGTY